MGFIGPNRIAIFHFRLNLVLKVMAKLLPNLNDSNNPGALNCFRALTAKAKELSNKVSACQCQVIVSRKYIFTISGQQDQGFTRAALAVFGGCIRSLPRGKVDVFCGRRV